MARPIGDRLAGAGLCGDEQIAVERLRLENGRLDGGRVVVAAIGEGAFEAGIGLAEMA